MGFVTVYNFIIIEPCYVHNNIEITNEAIYKCCENNDFISKPIVLSDENGTEIYIGYILGDLKFNKNGVLTSTVRINKEYSSRKGYDSWSIKYNIEKNDFEYLSCVLFK